MQKHYDIQERGQLEELPDGWFYQRDGNNKLVYYNFGTMERTTERKKLFGPGA